MKEIHRIILQSFIYVIYTNQCNSSYGFPVTVRITVSNFFIFQLQLLLLLTYLTYFSYNYS